MGDPSVLAVPAAEAQGDRGAAPARDDHADTGTGVRWLPLPADPVDGVLDEPEVVPAVKTGVAADGTARGEVRGRALGRLRAEPGTGDRDRWVGGRSMPGDTSHPRGRGCGRPDSHHPDCHDRERGRDSQRRAAPVELHAQHPTPSLRCGTHLRTRTRVRMRVARPLCPGVQEYTRRWKCVPAHGWVSHVCPGGLRRQGPALFQRIRTAQDLATSSIRSSSVGLIVDPVTFLRIR